VKEVLDAGPPKLFAGCVPELKPEAFGVDVPLTGLKPLKGPGVDG